MSITVDPLITAAQLLGSVVPVRKITFADNLLRWTDLTSPGIGTILGTVPQTYLFGSSLGQAFGTWRKTGSWSYITRFSPATASDWGLQVNTPIEIENAGLRRSMRTGLWETGTSVYAYNVLHDGSGIQCIRALLSSGTTTYPSPTWSNVGPVFGPARADTSTQVVRVEAVCPTDYGQIVAVGTHNFTLGRSMIQFYWITPGSRVIRLDVVIQLPLTEAYSSSTATAHHCTFISAVYNASTNQILIVANSHVSGKSVIFGVTDGICTSPVPVVQVDPDLGGTSFMANQIFYRSPFYHIVGQYSSIDDLGTTTYDALLRSKDGVHWSFGERNLIIRTGERSNGSLIYVPTAERFYFGGNSFAAWALVPPEYGVNQASLEVVATNKIIDATLTKGSSAADKLEAKLDNFDGALDEHSLIKQGSVAKLELGWDATLVTYGYYGVDVFTGSVSTAGRSGIRSTMRDLASRMIVEYQAPLEMEWTGAENFWTDLSTWKGLIAKTDAADLDIRLDSTNHLRHSGLNDPLVVLADTYDYPDGIGKATVTFANTAEAHHLSSFMFIIGCASDGSFTGIIIPKTGSWKTKTAPKVIESNLAPLDTEAETGGYLFESGWQGIWDSFNYDAGDPVKKYLNMVKEAPSSYILNTAWSAAAGTTYDFVYTRLGNRVQLHKKVRDLSVGGCTANAVYQEILDYEFRNDTIANPTGRRRPGFGGGTDVWARKDVYQNAAYGRKELAITSARNYQDTWILLGTAQVHSELDHIVSFGGFDSSDVYVGEWIRSQFPSGIRTWRIGTIDGSGIYAEGSVDLGNAGDVGLTGNIYIKTDEYWGEATSNRSSRTATGGEFWLDPITGKTIYPMVGRASFIGNDPADAIVTSRHVESDGVTHRLLDGSPNTPTPSGTNAGWDTTNPITVPNAWKMIFSHGGICKSWLSDDGLPTSGLLRITAKEIVRYVQKTYQTNKDAFDAALETKKLTMIPTYYTTPAVQTVVSSTITNARRDGHDVGDDLGAIPDAAGMLVEISSRGGEQGAPEVPVLHVVSNGYNGSSVGQIVIDQTLQTKLTEEDYLIITGNRQFGTEGGPHASDAVVSYYPSTLANGLVDHFLKVHSYGYYAGLNMNVKEAVKHLCSVAGMHDYTFRNMMASPNTLTGVTLNLTAVDQTIPSVDQLADFCLEGRIHLPGNNLVAGAVSGARRLMISFRNYYTLTIEQYTSQTEFTAGRYGSIRICLGPSAGDVIDLPDGYDGAWFEGIIRKFTAESLAGTVSGSGSDFTVTDVPSRMYDFKLVANGSIISFELAGQLLYTFNLDDLVHTDGTSYKRLTPGPLLVRYSATVTSATGTFRVSELDQNIERVSLGLGNNPASEIGMLIKKRQISYRPITTGGLHFSQMVVRDDAGAFPDNVFVHDWSMGDQDVPGHVISLGKARSQHLDMAWIRKQGYSVAIINSDLSDTPSNSLRQAKLAVLAAIANGNSQSVTSIPFLQVEVGDRISLDYSGQGNDTASHTSTDHIVTGIKIKLTKSSAAASYTLKNYQGWA